MELSMQAAVGHSPHANLICWDDANSCASIFGPPSAIFETLLAKGAAEMIQTSTSWNSANVSKDVRDRVHSEPCGFCMRLV